MSEHAINGFMGISMEKIRSVVDANTMIGDPIHCGDGTTVIPVSKVSMGFATGGLDYNGKQEMHLAERSE